MSDLQARVRRFWHWVGLGLSILFAIYSNPPVASGQAKFTMQVRGTVVDEAGKPVENARVALVTGSRARVEAKAPAGEFTLTIDYTPSSGAVLAWDDAGRLQGAHVLGPRPLKRDAAPLRIVLKRPRELVVTVTNADGQPIAGARVGGTSRLSGFSPSVICEQATDDSGKAVLRFPSEITLDSVFAVKRDVGVNFNSLTPGPAEAQTILLGNNVTAQVRVTDDEDQPLAGVAVQATSLLIGRASLLAQDMEELKVTTDATGLATFRTLPSGLTSRVNFRVQREGYTTIQSAAYDPRTASEEVRAVLAPLVTLRGKVSGADGKPAGSAHVQAVGVSQRQRQSGASTLFLGWGADSNSLVFRATCDAAGAFELPVARNHYYAILASLDPNVARKESVVSSIQTVVVRGAPPALPLAFSLGPGTRVFGVATQPDGRAKSRPLSSQPVRLHWRDAGSYAKLPESERLPNPNGQAEDLSPSLVCDSRTDVDGRFEFIVPPGSYALSAVTRGSNVVLDIKDQTEIQADFITSGVAPGVVRDMIEPPPAVPVRVIELAGRVVLAADREHGIGKVNVRRIDLGRSLVRPENGPSTSAITAEDGTFKMSRLASDALILASTSDGLLSCIVKIQATATDVVLPLGPSATFRGRLIDELTKKPLVGREIDTSIQVDLGMSQGLGNHAISDQSGQFVLTGMPVGWPIKVMLIAEQSSIARGGVALNMSNRWKTLIPATAQQSGIEKLGDLPISDSKTPSLDQLIANATKNEYVQTGRLESKLGEAEMLDGQVLVFAAASGSEVCHEFFKNWYGFEQSGPNESLAEIAKRYVLVPLDTTQADRRGRTVLPILSQVRLSLPGAEEAGFSIIRPDGEVVAVTTSEKLSGGKFDAEKLAEFLRKHAPPLPDAEKLLDDALAEAKRSGKRVFVYQCVPLSAPSALLSLFVDSQRELLEKDYVCLKLDARYSKAEAAIRRAGGELGRHPWIGILDESGKLLTGSVANGGAATSEMPGVARVQEMLRATARKLTAEEIQTVVKSLWIP